MPACWAVVVVEGSSDWRDICSWLHNLGHTLTLSRSSGTQLLAWGLCSASLHPHPCQDIRPFKESNVEGLFRDKLSIVQSTCNSWWRPDLCMQAAGSGRWFPRGHAALGVGVGVEVFRAGQCQVMLWVRAASCGPALVEEVCSPAHVKVPKCFVSRVGSGSSSELVHRHPWPSHGSKSAIVSDADV